MVVKYTLLISKHLSLMFIVISCERLSSIIIKCTYLQTYNISRILGNKLVDHSDVVGVYIFILDLTHGLNGMGKSNCKTSRESFKGKPGFFQIARMWTKEIVLPSSKGSWYYCWNASSYGVKFNHMWYFLNMHGELRISCLFCGLHIKTSW